MKKLMKTAGRILAVVLSCVSLYSTAVSAAALPPKGNYQITGNMNAMIYLYHCASWQNRLRDDMSKGKIWRYTNSGADLKKNLTNCAHFADSIAVRSGLIGSMYGMYSTGTAGYFRVNGNYYNAKTKTWKNAPTAAQKKALADIESKFTIVTSYYGKYVASVQKQLQPGDIVLYRIQHTNVYAGYLNGKYCWYDAGHANCSARGEMAPFKTFYVERTPSNLMVDYVLRPKPMSFSTPGINVLEKIGSKLSEAKALELDAKKSAAGIAKVKKATAQKKYQELNTAYGVKLIDYLKAKGVRYVSDIVRKSAPVARN